MRAYVFVDASIDDSWEIVSEIRKNPHAFLADVINGPHPVIAGIECRDPSTVAQTILFDIRKITGVTDITVLLAMETRQEADNLSSGIGGAAMEDSLPVVFTAGKNEGRKKRVKRTGD
ncbi:MAG: hypothetical protein JW712_09735 [Dehalococcoidales bacterium]|nr:hypothetical protein [Dehalococcoidales bacterium]